MFGCRKQTMPRIRRHEYDGVKVKSIRLTKKWTLIKRKVSDGS